jgi:hypothetical protein
MAQKAIYSAGDNTLKEIEDSIEDSVSILHFATGKTYPCDPSCKDAGWKDGQVLREGIDFRLQLWGGGSAMYNNAGEWQPSKATAFPIKPSTTSTEDQDELWELVIDTILKNKRSDSKLLAELKWMIHLTKIH